MKREIKFRGKRVDNDEWAYGFVYRHDPPLQCFVGDNKELPTFSILKTGFADWNMPRPIEQHEVDGKTISEYTGLNDKNNKEIFGGDIWKCENKIGVVVYFECSWKIKWDTNEIERNAYGDLFLNVTTSILPDECIIGNIYDNPELIH